MDGFDNGLFSPGLLAYASATLDQGNDPLSPYKTKNYIEQAAAKYGFQPSLLDRIVKIESSGNPNARTGSYKGLFQLSDSEFGRYGGGNIYDPVDNTNAAAAKLAAERDTFQSRYGREPSATDLYLTHQQGEGGYGAHMTNPGAPAWVNMASTAEGRQKGEGWAKQAIWGNLPASAKQRFGSVDNVTSADFIDVWRNRVEGGGTPAASYAETSSSARPYADVQASPRPATETGTKKMGLFDQLLGRSADVGGQSSGGTGLLGALGDPQMLASIAMIAKGISPNSQLQPQEMMQNALALKQRQAEIAQRQAEANRQAGFEERRVSLAEKTAGITPTARDLMSMGLQPGTQEYKDTYEKMVGLQKKGWQPVSVKTQQGEQTFFTDGNQFKRPDELIQGFSQQPGVGGPYKDIAELRKEYIAQPNVRSYQQAITPYQSMVKSADVDTATADIDLISGLAKVLDPDSVVREGEYATVQKSNSLSEQLKGRIQYVFEGKGKLTSESRKQLMAIARNRVDSYRGGAQSQVERYRGLAKKFNFDPSAVVEDTPETPTWPKSQGKPYSGNLPPPPPGFVVQ